MPTSSTSELRKFGLTVGGAFIVLGGISFWRGHEIAPRVLWVLAVLLVVPGALFPTVLGPIQRGWMQMAAFLGHVNTRIILTALYYIVLTPVGLIMRLFRDPLERSWKNPGESMWIKRPQQPVDPARYERQF